MINIGSLDIDDIYVGDSSVDKIYVGNDLVWSCQPSPSNQFVLNVTTVTGENPNVIFLRFKMKLSSAVTVTFDGETQTFTPQDVDSNGYVYPYFTRNEHVTDNLIITGGFTEISTHYTSGAQNTVYIQWKINSVVQWYSGDTLYPHLFEAIQMAHYGLPDTQIPSTITKIYNNFAGFGKTDFAITLGNNIEYIEKMWAGFKNDTPVDDVYYKNNVACGYANDSRTEPVTIANGTTKLAAYLFSEGGYFDGVYYSNSHLTGINFPNDGVLTEIPDNFMEPGSSAITTLSIPSSINKIGVSAFQTFTALTDIYFYSNNITLPNAGSGTGMLYYKSSQNLNVYTNNKTVVDYDWISDNRVVTLYHTDNTAWSIVGSPTLSVTNNILTITPSDADSDYYNLSIKYSTGLMTSETVKITTSSTTVDLTPYIDSYTQYTVTCRAMTNNPNKASATSVVSVSVDNTPTE